ncbi:glyoxylase-like metal-dependent hydrolase (beta-lactamase superfamily II) [Stackebrandtia albiflava]|uniref:Glyoxylase-like metal-dependent hydrolase (Beta-lactamase superfamily II) n=1 Tax=Stackebrandtia albiflava TaxID=406432 RepID=A0A562VCZ8_9ACTN|nr:MBL fold metallo-hydrolase [Stackebrandtia albiflava]TWJ15691.1 glyoxylase-like metal-dependent hydrolase (beta-lactamase superfamily II) [Stackebrandtia albiflava]
MNRPFASSRDLTPKTQTLETIGDGVWALTAEGDPNVGAVEGEDFLVCIEATATPHTASQWLRRLRRHTDKPVRHLVLTHYHAVRTLGASAFDATEIIAHENTHALIRERGRQDWESEHARMPRLFDHPETIPGLTHPTVTFTDRLTIPLGGDRGDLVLAHCGPGHTEGDIVAWIPRQRILFAGDLVESRAALYTGDAFHHPWSTTTLDRIAAFEADTLVGGRGATVTGHADVNAAIGQTRRFLTTMIERTRAVHDADGTLEAAYAAVHDALAPEYGRWPIFQHCLPFNVSRLWDELDGITRPRIWTTERDRQIWERLQD